MKWTSHLAQGWTKIPGAQQQALKPVALFLALLRPAKPMRSTAIIICDICLQIFIKQKLSKICGQSYHITSIQGF